MYIRTYFDKDNTIISNSTINQGANPIGTLFFGGDYSNPQYSRYIFHFDESNLRVLYNNCMLGDLSKVTHRLVFKPNRFFGSIDKNNPPCLATSYDLCLFQINQDWVEGCGYDYDCMAGCNGYISRNCNSSNSASNWYFAQDGQRWDVDGIYDAYYSGDTTGTTLTGDTPYIICQKYECDDCLLIYDVTDIVNNFITGGTLNYGFGLAFHRDYEINPTGDIKYVGVYGKETPNFFKPYLETEYINPIIDDRGNFFMDKDNKLYLYVNIGGNPTNLDSNPIVNIYDEQDNLYTTLTGECVTLGVYSINLNIPQTGVTDCVVWRDVWTNLSILGRARPDAELEFELKQSNDYFFTGLGVTQTKKYGFRVWGIRKNESIKRGDNRKIVIESFEQFNLSRKLSLDNIFYRLYVKEGEEQLDVIQWTQVNKAICENFIYLDTSWLLPQNYYIDFKIVIGYDETLYPEQIKFYILDDKVKC